MIASHFLTEFPYSLFLRNIYLPFFWITWMLKGIQTFAETQPTFPVFELEVLPVTPNSPPALPWHLRS